MDFFATGAADGGSVVDGSERREAQRFTSLIRAAKLLGPQGEFVCVIRDVSASGIRLRCFHKLPTGPITLMLQNGETYGLTLVRDSGQEASFTFTDEVDVQHLIVETSKYPKRQLRVSVNVPAQVSTLTQQQSAVIHNISQQGALVECDALFAIEQPLKIEARQLPQIRAKVRWRSEEAYGVAFDNTFTLREFAVQVASLQCAELLRD